MGKAAFLAGLSVLVLCSRALAQSSVPVVSPTVTPVPPVKNVTNQTFTLKDNDNSSLVCLKVTMAIVVNFTYLNTEKKNVSLVVPVTDKASKNMANSSCYINATRATLTIVPDTDEAMPPFQIRFTFTGDNKTTKNHWAWDDMTLVLEDVTYLDDYGGDGLGPIEFNTSDALHGDSNSRIEFERSYQCAANQRITFNKSNEIYPSMNVSQLQAQAFHFTNATTGDFDNARVCLLDTAGKANKIVPIAVGAALAGLVVVVLIAYLIGRLRSRRQSSYEALS